jgi:hypothetical protein
MDSMEPPQLGAVCSARWRWARAPCLYRATRQLFKLGERIIWEEQPNQASKQAPYRTVISTVLVVATRRISTSHSVPTERKTLPNAAIQHISIWTNQKRATPHLSRRSVASTTRTLELLSLTQHYLDQNKKYYYD